MNPLRMLAIYRKASVVMNLLEDAQMNKKLWKSKTFWFNILSGAAALTGVIPFAPEHVAIATAIINVGLRFVTDKPVSI
jgi:hypothetical protein